MPLDPKDIQTARLPEIWVDGPIKPRKERSLGVCIRLGLSDKQSCSAADDDPPEPQAIKYPVIDSLRRRAERPARIKLLSYRGMICSTSIGLLVACVTKALISRQRFQRRSEPSV